MLFDPESQKVCRDDIEPGGTPAADQERQQHLGQLVDALISKTPLYADASTRAQPSRPRIGQEAMGDIIGEACRDAVANMLAAFDNPTALSRAMILPVGKVTGSTVVEIALLDSFLHAWDLPRASGQAFSADPTLPHAVYSAAPTSITNELPAKGKFAAQITAIPNAPDLDTRRFAGRHPTWRPPELGDGIQPLAGVA